MSDTHDLVIAGVCNIGNSFLCNPFHFSSAKKSNLTYPALMRRVTLCVKADPNDFVILNSSTCENRLCGMPQVELDTIAFLTAQLSVTDNELKRIFVSVDHIMRKEDPSCFSNLYDIRALYLNPKLLNAPQYDPRLPGGHNQGPAGIIIYACIMAARTRLLLSSWSPGGRSYIASDKVVPDIPRPLPTEDTIRYARGISVVRIVLVL
jgi:hypothetical protein